MWATTKKNGTYHATYELNGEPVAACNRRIRPTVDAREFDANSPDGRCEMDNYKLCNKCTAKRAQTYAVLGAAHKPTESLPEPDPTRLALKAAGYSSDEYNTLTLIPIILGWLADDVAVFDDPELLDIIASKHKITA